MFHLDLGYVRIRMLITQIKISYLHAYVVDKAPIFVYIFNMQLVRLAVLLYPKLIIKLYLG